MIELDVTIYYCLALCLVYIKVGCISTKQSFDSNLNNIKLIDNFWIQFEKTFAEARSRNERLKNHMKSNKQR